MSDAPLAKIDLYGAHVAFTVYSFSQLTKRRWASGHTAATMSPLLKKLGDHLQAVSSVEETITLPTLHNARKDLTRCILADNDDLPRLASQLARHVEPLDQSIKSHTTSLANIKRLEKDSQTAESSLLSCADDLEKRGKQRKVDGYMTSFVGGMLLIPTLGGSRGLINVGDDKFQDGENSIHEHHMIKAEMVGAFSRFTGLLHSSIDIVESLSGMIVSLSSDIRALSTSKTPRQIRKIRAKSADVSRMLARYITVTEAVFGTPKYFPYRRTSKITCDGCRDEIKAGEMFFHCNTCSNVDFCVKCYPQKRHESHARTKHCKAQYLIQGSRICNLCYGVIMGGNVAFCGSCDFELCSRCRDQCGHAHALERVEVRWYGDFVPSKTKCDECWRPGKEVKIMYQCLECYWYFICQNCRKKTSAHPHELISFEVSEEGG